ncbi:hypothetical protein [Streptomyces sp. cg36]|uniref:hypothetical protein n=1 Tax=Streptomyces sp. cg36 TaxID=3238798 RepID=UPI0034E1D94E
MATGYLREPDIDLPMPGPDFAHQIRALLETAAHRPAVPRPLPARPAEEATVPPAGPGFHCHGCWKAQQARLDEEKAKAEAKERASERIGPALVAAAWGPRAAAAPPAAARERPTKASPTPAMCCSAAGLARRSGDRRIERLATQHLARHQADAGHWHQGLTTTDRALEFDYRPGATDIPHILLLIIKGEALVGLGHHTDGATQLDLAAREAEAAGYDDGTVRALAALLRAAPDPDIQARYDTALARLTTRA